MEKGEVWHVAGGVTAPKGFLAAGVSCGIKRKGNRDLALVFSQLPAIAHAVFTTNQIKAAPVLVSREHVLKGKTQAVVINSGNANSCTGELGIKNAKEAAKVAGEALKIPPQSVLVGSTGIIGVPLPMDKVAQGIKLASKVLSKESGEEAAEAIMTTDSFSKETAVSFQVDGKEVTVGGMAKGSGMIAPKMATMLAVITTDAVIEKKALTQAFDKAVGQSFNMITVDGNTSTNDSVFILANGQAKSAEIKPPSSSYKLFVKALSHVMGELAELIVKDGEGASKFIEIEVKGAKSFADAKDVALKVANANLVKCAFFGEDPNWGRIIAAIGMSAAKIDPAKIDIYFGNELIVKGGMGFVYCAQTVGEILGGKEIKVIIDLNLGKEQATVWTTDLTYDYVRLNAEYKT